jgi:homoserine O-acetyltransferase
MGYRHKVLDFSSMDDFILNFMFAYFSVMDPSDLLCMAWKGSVAMLAATLAGICGLHWAGSKPKRLSCRCLRTCSFRRLTAKPSGDLFLMPSSGLSRPSMGTSRYSALIPMRSIRLDKHLTELLAVKN